MERISNSSCNNTQEKEKQVFLPFCRSCGKEVAPDSAFCPSCGQPTGLGQQAPAAPPMSSSISPNASSLFSASNILMQKKIFSMREHYDFTDPSGNKLGEGDGNFFQFPAKFQVLDNTGALAMSLEGKLISIRKQFNFYDAQGNALGS